MAKYTTTDFLLDRANIHDTVTKLYLFADRRELDRFDEVAASSMVFDYTLMFGGEPQTFSPVELSEFYRNFLTKMSTTQHIVTSLVIELPQPGNSEEVAKAKVTGNIIANLTRKDVDGGIRTSNAPDWSSKSSRYQMIWNLGCHGGSRSSRYSRRRRKATLKS